MVMLLVQTAQVIAEESMRPFQSFQMEWNGNQETVKIEGDRNYSAEELQIFPQKLKQFFLSPKLSSGKAPEGLNLNEYLVGKVCLCIITTGRSLIIVPSTGEVFTQGAFGDITSYSKRDPALLLGMCTSAERRVMHTWSIVACYPC